MSDEVMDHDAKLLALDGRMRIVGVSCGGKNASGKQVQGANPIYSWIGSTFDVHATMVLGGFTRSCTTSSRGSGPS